MNKQSEQAFKLTATFELQIKDKTVNLTWEEAWRLYRTLQTVLNDANSIPTPNNPIPTQPNIVFPPYSPQKPWPYPHDVWCSYTTSQNDNIN